MKREKAMVQKLNIAFSTGRELLPVRPLSWPRLVSVGKFLPHKEGASWWLLIY